MDFILSKIISRPKSLISFDEPNDSEINENSVDQANNLRSPKRTLQFDGLNEGDKEEGSDNKEKLTENEKSLKSLSSSEGDKFDPIKEADICQKSALPDIVQPVINITNNQADDSPITALAHKIANLKICPTKGDNNLTVPNQYESHSGFSSDDEPFAECQTFLEPINATQDSINQWANVLSSVSSQNVEDLDNIIEQSDIDANQVNEKEIQSHKEEVNEIKSVTQFVPSEVVETDTNTLPELNSTTPIVQADESPNKTIDVIQEEVDKLHVPLELPPEGNLSGEINVSVKSVDQENSNLTEIVNRTVDQSSSENLMSISGENPLSVTVDITNVTENNFNSTYNQQNLSAKSDSASDNLPNSSVHLNGSLARSAEELNSCGSPQFINNNIVNSMLESNHLDGTFDIKPTELDKPSNIDIVPETSNDQGKMVKDCIEITDSIGAPGDLIIVQEEDISMKTNEPNLMENKNKLNKTLLNTETQALDRSLNKQQNESTNRDLCDDDIAQDNKNESDSNPSKRQIRPASEKDFVVENFVTDQIDVTFKTPAFPMPFGKKRNSQDRQDFDDEEFRPSNEIILNPSHFDFLLSKGNNNSDINERNSLLLRFDPLVGYPVLANINTSLNSSNQELGTCLAYAESHKPLTPTKEEEEIIECKTNQPLIDISNDQQESRLNVTVPVGCDISPEPAIQVPQPPENINLNNSVVVKEEENNLDQSFIVKKDVKMSVDVIHDIKLENDVKSIDNIDSQTDEKQEYKMAELEKKFKNDALKTEEIERKLKDAEAREEALLKRITEKDKTIGKMNEVVKAYEKTITELIAEKEQIIQKYEKQMAEIKSDRDLNYQHLTSLETTFSDLHAKYERSKQTGLTIKANVEALMSEKEKTIENLILQEARYEKMKNHALQQLEIANNKLETLSKNHTSEVTKLKALLKKEEISRLSINEQLQQKSRENEELMKICDELINGQGS